MANSRTEIESLPFDEIWTLDLEFRAPPGERPTPHCLVAHELLSGRVIRMWLGKGAPYPPAPFDAGERSLFVAYYSSAEWSCFLALGWPLPVHVLDLFAEFRQHTNGRSLRHGNGLLGALLFHGLPGLGAQEKSDMRDLAIRGGPFSPSEKDALLDYCESDVDALDLLLPRMLPTIDLPRALIRGRYMKAVTRMEWTGIPIDLALHAKLISHWPELIERLTTKAHEVYGVYPDGHFSARLFADWLTERGVRWPTTPTGRLALNRETMKEMCRAHPELELLRQTRGAMGKMRPNNLSVGADARNRTLLSPFKSKTSRNQPSSSAYIFGQSAWLRNLIRPEPGRAVMNLDYEQQEFGIAGVLADDTAMLNAYNTGDPYIAFAKRAGAIPQDATAVSHPHERSRYKLCALGVQYGMGARSLALCIEQSPAHAEVLLESHRRAYPAYWRWASGMLDSAILRGRLQTALGWQQHVCPPVNPRSLQNFPIQGNGAEMLRLACIFATERGLNVCGPVHDALLIESAADDVANAAATASEAMLDASRVVLSGFELRTEVLQVISPSRFREPRGEGVWATINQVLR